MSLRQEHVVRRGVDFYFWVDAATGRASQVRVLIDEPIPYAQTFQMTDPVEPASFAEGWFQARYRDVVHLL